MLELGVITRAIGTDTVTFCPPFVTTDEQVDRIVDALATALSELAERRDERTDRIVGRFAHRRVPGDLSGAPRRRLGSATWPVFPVGLISHSAFATSTQ